MQQQEMSLQAQTQETKKSKKYVDFVKKLLFKSNNSHFFDFSVIILVIMLVFSGKASQDIY